MHCIVSVDGSPRLNWGARLLGLTWREVGMEGKFTRLWASEMRPPPWEFGETFVTPNYSNSDGQGQYHPFNRVIGLDDLCQAGGIDPEDTVFVLDPDMVFIKKVDTVLSHGEVIGSPWDSLDYDLKRFTPDFLARHCQRPDQITLIGNPYMMTGRDLATAYAQLGERTRALRRDDPRPNWWVDEMWALIFIFADMGLRQVIDRTLCREVLETHDLDGASLLHYAWALPTFSKFTWMPEQGVQRPETARTAVSTFFDILERNLGSL